ncbi:MAG: hypothetical protein HQK66_15385 [Desulfamplus sp.]|nr:hypothetical protein [Desulfamplus sp.]
MEVKNAVMAAMNAAQEFYDGKELLDLSLEEVELTDDEKYWLITLGFDFPIKKTPANQIVNPIMTAFGKDYIRKYKIFKVDAMNGEVKSMKIREI